MATMLDDVAAVETAGRPPTRSPDTKAAINYLAASGAVAISITADADGIAMSVGIKRDAVAAYWLPETMVRSVAAKARNIMGDAGGVDEAISALQEAAAKCAVTLTPHATATKTNVVDFPGGDSTSGRRAGWAGWAGCANPMLNERLTSVVAWSRCRTRCRHSSRRAKKMSPSSSTILGQGRHSAR
jgi:hypothetical protein